MKKINRWLLGLLVIIIGLASYLVVEANGSSGQFLSMSHAGVQHELFKEHEKVYIGKKLKWTGKELPTIKDVAIYIDENKILKEDNPEIRIQTYVDEQHQTNVIYEYTTENRKIISNYKRVQDYQLKSKNLNLVFEVELINPGYQFNLDTFEIDFEVEGEVKKQKLIMKSFIFHQ